jgi:arsenical pump membrane protein
MPERSAYISGAEHYLGDGVPGIHQVVWGVALLSVVGVITRPWHLPEFIWAVAGAVILVVAGLLSVPDALLGLEKGTDVYLFLAGMMLLAEIARNEGLFDWLAAHAAARARGSATRLFALVYLVGTLVTVFLSNDATAVVLTPAVAAAAKAARADQPLPYLLTCAFIANAASFVLPISNPANLVVYGSHVPPLLAWFPTFALPSVLAIGATYGMLRLAQRQALRQVIASAVEVPALSGGGKVAACGIAATALVLTAASALDWQLGLPTFVAGFATAAIVLIAARQSPWPVIRGISWGVLPLVAGLFVLVEALDRSGIMDRASGLLRLAAAHSPAACAWATGIVVAMATNLLNNLPAGLIAATAAHGAQASPLTTDSVLIGIDLGPNLSVTGSLATILWLSALRRDGLHVSGWSFLKIGCLVMPPALALALAGLFLA